MDNFHLCRFLKSVSHHSWLNFYSGKWILQQNIFFFAFTFSGIEKKTIHTGISMTMKNIREKDVTFAVTPSAVVLETHMQQC